MITLKKTAVSRGSFILLAGFLLLIAYLWVNESYPGAMRFFLFFCPHVFLFLSQDMFREEIESGALESVLFLTGGSGRICATRPSSWRRPACP